MKYKWLHFWNVRFDKAFGRFVNHYGQVCDLDEKGKQASLKRRYHYWGMRLEMYVEMFCDFMCRIAGH
jgi:hypothetical protein